jgi:uncharacterized protein (TIGR04255 family)
MVARDVSLPRHIEPDAILESVLEVRFDAPTVLPEILFGRLAEHSAWNAFQQRRLPLAEIPAPMREADVNLRFTPTFELIDSNNSRAVRVGPHVFSYHVKAPYPGWIDYRRELDLAVDELFVRAPITAVKRLGMRYTNGLRSDLHGIESPRDLDLSISVSHEPQNDKINLNYITDPFPDVRCTVRIATREFIGGQVPPEPNVFIDVDVYTEDFPATDATSVKNWVNRAHDVAKGEFFHLLTETTVQRLKRD